MKPLNFNGVIIQKRVLFYKNNREGVGMIQSIEQIMNTQDAKGIENAISVALKNSSEAPFWVEKSQKLSEAVFSILVPLREQKLLFTPEGTPVDTITKELFYAWCDLYSLKMLGFIIQESNNSEKLVRTKYSEEDAQRFKVIDLDILGYYLSSFTINLEREDLDFPIANYNLHQGMITTLKSVL